jgi:hypothetical protein
MAPKMPSLWAWGNSKFVDFDSERDCGSIFVKLADKLFISMHVYRSPIILISFTMAAMLLLFQNCGGGGSKSSGSSTYSSSSAEIKQLYQSDLQSLDSLMKGASSVDANYSNAFTKVFGGTSANSLRTYLNDRVKVAMTEEDLDASTLSPAALLYQGWLQKVGPESAFSATDKKVIVMASNFGSLLFLQGRVDGRTYRVTDPSGRLYTVTSSRSGMIELGSAYATYHPQIGQIPREFRVGVLVHEGRHSDCTGGIPTGFVQKARAATSNAALLQSLGVAQVQCTHMHITCPTGHSLAGIAACDADVWSAYGVDSIFNLANIANAASNSKERAVLEAIALDSLGRLPLNAANIIRTTSPNMVHTESP